MEDFSLVNYFFFQLIFCSSRIRFKENQKTKKKKKKKILKIKNQFE